MADYIMDVTQAVKGQSATLLGCKKEEKRSHKHTSEKTIDTPFNGHVIQSFDVIVLPGTHHAGKPFIGITKRVKFRKETPKSRDCCQQRRYHRSVHRKSTAFSKLSSSFIGKSRCLSAPCRFWKREGEDHFESPVHADLKIRKCSKGFRGSKSCQNLISVYPEGFSKGQRVSTNGCAQVTDEVPADPLFYSNLGITSGSLETCNVIRSTRQEESILSQHFEAGNLEFVFVTYDMEEQQLLSQPDTESANEEPAEEYDPFYKCAFEFAKTHGYGFVEFVEENTFAKKPRRRILRKKYQTILVKKDDRVNPVYFVSWGSKIRRNHRDKCVAKPRGNFVGLSNESSPFKLAGYDTIGVETASGGGETSIGGVETASGGVEKVSTRSLPVKTGFMEEVSPRMKLSSRVRLAASVAGALMVSPGRVDKSDDLPNGNCQTLSSSNEAGSFISGRSRDGKVKTGKPWKNLRSASAIVENTLNTSPNICITAKSGQRETNYILNSRSLDFTTVDTTTDMLKGLALVESSSKKQKRSQVNEQTVACTTIRQDKLIIADQEIPADDSSPPGNKPRMILPRLQDVTSLEYRLCNSMSATIFRETQRAKQGIDVKKHSDKLSIANVDVVHFAYQHGQCEEKNRPPSSGFSNRHRGRAHPACKSPQCMLPGGSFMRVCARRKPHISSYSSQAMCERVESWPNLGQHSPSSLLRNPEVTIATCGSSPPIANVISTVGDSPTKFELNPDSSPKTSPPRAREDLRNSTNEQGLDLKRQTQPKVHSMIFPASVPQVREHCRLRQSVEPYSFEDGDIRELTHSFISYSNTLDKRTRGKRLVTSTINQASVNNNKCSGYSKDLSDGTSKTFPGHCQNLVDIYGECSYSHDRSLVEPTDSPPVQDTNNNARRDHSNSTDNSSRHDMRNEPGHSVSNGCKQTDRSTTAVRKKLHLIRVAVFFHHHERISPDGRCKLHACDSEDIPTGISNIDHKRNNQSQKQQLRNTSVNASRNKKKSAYLAKGCRNVGNDLGSYTNKKGHSLKENQSCNPSLPSASAQFPLKNKKLEFKPGNPVTCQQAEDLNTNNNSSNNVRKKPSGARNKTVRNPRRSGENSKRLSGQRRLKQSKPKRKIVKRTRYSITWEGWKVLRKNKYDPTTYIVAPAGYKALYENLRKQCEAIQKPAPPARWTSRSSDLCSSCNAVEKIVDRFRKLITLFPEKRLSTLQKILRITDNQATTDKRVSPASTESLYSCSSSKLIRDVTTCKSPRNLCKQRPGTIYQSVVPSGNICCNTMSPLGCCTTCMRPSSMTRSTQAGEYCGTSDDATTKVRHVHLKPVDSLTLARERLSNAKEKMETKRMSKPNNSSENTCCKTGPSNGGSRFDVTDVINDITGMPVYHQGSVGRQKQVTNLFPVTQQFGKVGVLPGTSNVESKTLQFKNHLRSSKLSVQSGSEVGDNNHKLKPIKWNLSDENSGFFRDLEYPSDIYRGPSWKGTGHLRNWTYSSMETCSGDICGKTNDFRVQGSVSKADTYNLARKRHQLGPDQQELPKNGDSSSHRKILCRSPRNNIMICEPKISDGCNKSVTTKNCDTDHQSEAGGKRKLNLQTIPKLVEAFFIDHPAVNEGDKRVEINQNIKVLNKNAGNFVNKRLTTGNRTLTSGDVKLPNSDAIISDGLQMNSGEKEGSHDSGDIEGSHDRGDIEGSHDSGDIENTHDVKLLKLDAIISDGLQMKSGDKEGSHDSGDIEGSHDRGDIEGSHDRGDIESSHDSGDTEGSHDSGDTEGSHDSSATGCHPGGSQSSLEQTGSSGSTRSTLDSNCTARTSSSSSSSRSTSSRCSSSGSESSNTRSCTQGSCVDSPNGLRETSVMEDHKCIPTTNYDVNIRNIFIKPHLVSQTSKLPDDISTHGGLMASQSHASTNSKINVMECLENPHFEPQTSNLPDENGSPSDTCDLTQSSSGKQPYLRVNTPGISTHWVCVLPGRPTLHTCSSSTGQSHTTGSDNNSKLDRALGPEEPGFQSSVSMSLVTQSNMVDNQLSTTVEESEEVGLCHQGPALRESPSSGEIAGNDETTILNRGDQPCSSNNSIGSSVSSSQCNNNNNIVLSLPFLRMPELAAHGGHLETAWRSSRKQLQKEALQGRLADEGNKQQCILMGSSKIATGFSYRNIDGERWFQGKCEELLSEQHDKKSCGIKENARRNQESVPSEYIDSLSNENHEKLLHEYRKKVLNKSCEYLLNTKPYCQNLEDSLPGNHKHLDHKNVRRGNNQVLPPVNHKSLLDVNPEMTLVKPKNSQPASSDKLNSESGKPGSRKRHMNEPVEDMAPPCKIRRLGTSLLQPLEQEESRHKKVRRTKHN